MSSRLQAIAAALYLLLSSLAFVYAFQFVDRDDRFQVYFQKGDPLIVEYNKMRDTFAEDNSLYVLFEGDSLFEPHFLGKVDELSARLSEDPGIDKVQSVLTIDHVEKSADGFDIRPIVDMYTMDETTSDELRARASTNRFALKNLVSEDLSAMAFQIIPPDEVRRGDEIIERFVAEAEKLGLQGYVTGRAGALENWSSLMEIADQNTFRMLPVIIGFGLLVLWWLYHRWIALFLTSILALNSGLFANAIFPIFGQPYTVLSSLTPAILSALALAFAIHLFNAVAKASSRGLSGCERLQDALSHVKRPMLFSAVTTSVGLLSIASGGIPAAQWMGISSGLAVLYIYFLTTVVFPPILIEWDRSEWSVKSGFNQLNSLIRGLSRMGLRYPWAVIGVCFTLIATMIPMIPKITVESNFTRFFKAEHPLIQSIHRMEEKLSGVNGVQVYLSGPESSLKSIDNMKRIQKFNAWAIQLESVDFTMSHVDIIEEMYWAFRDNSEARELPQSEKMVDQLLLINSGENIWDFTNRDFSEARIPLRLNIHGAADSAKLVKILDSKLSELFEGSEIRFNTLGNGRFNSELLTRIIYSQIYSIGLAGTIIFFLMCFFWRDYVGAAICMIPNLAPLIVAMAGMYMFGLWMDIATSMFASVALGIAVDDTLHIFHAFRAKNRGNALFALVRAYKTAGRAVLATSIVLSAQYAVLMWSDYIPFTNFSIVMVVSMVAALIYDLLLLPSLLLVYYHRPQSTFTH